MVTHVQVMHAYNLRIQWVETGGSGIHAILDHIASLRPVGDTISTGQDKTEHSGYTNFQQLSFF